MLSRASAKRTNTRHHLGEVAGDPNDDKRIGHRLATAVVPGRSRTRSRSTLGRHARPLSRNAVITDGR